MSVTVKVYYYGDYGTDIRRFCMARDEVTKFAVLKERIMSLYQITSPDYVIYWIDSENDRIRITSDEELAEAIANSDKDLLRLYLYQILKNSYGIEQQIPSKCMKPTPDQVHHPNVVCDKGISGFRYKCLECPDFDLCSQCNYENAHSSHDMVKLTRPSYIARKWVFQGAPKMWKSMFQPSIARFYRNHFQRTKDEEAKDCNTEPKVLQEFVETLTEVLLPPKDGEKKTAEGNPNSCDPNVFEIQSDLFPIPLELGQNVTKIFQDLKNQWSDFVKDPEAAKKQWCDFLNVPYKQCDSVKDPEAPCSSTSAQTEAPVTTDQPTQVEASTSGNAEAGPSAVESIPMEIGKNQTPTEVEDENCIEEIIVDPENGTTQAQEQPKVTDDWTLLDADISTSSRMDCAPTSCGEAMPKPSHNPFYPTLEEMVTPAPRPATYIRSRDPKIRSAVMTMQGMGFSNEGGWLETLLASKNGNINETLESLYPTMR